MGLFKTYSEKQIKKIIPLVNRIEELGDTFSSMTDDELRSYTDKLKGDLANGKTLDDILPEAFALVREADDRVLGKRPFRVQLMGGILLHQGRIAEMKTGEGKTLVATLPAYLNALTGKGVHIVTVNDYLATRDSEEMGRVYAFLGLTTGLIVHGQTADEKRKQYACDITYGTNNELGFDYLRDNMVVYKEKMVQRGHNFAIVDEVDSILIDEARTPLIISGVGANSTDLYTMADRCARTLTKHVIKEIDDKADNDELFSEDYIVDEKAKTAVLTKHRGAKAALAPFDPLPQAGDEEEVPTLKGEGLPFGKGEGQNAPVDAVAAIALGGKGIADVAKAPQNLLAGGRLFPGGTVSGLSCKNAGTELGVFKQGFPVPEGGEGL